MSKVILHSHKTFHILHTHNSFYYTKVTNFFCILAYIHEASYDCPSGAILGIFIPLLCLLLVVIGLLLLTVQRTKSPKKQKDHMWAENNPLKPVPEPAAGEGDNA